MEIRKAYQTDAYSLINIMDRVWKNTYCDILPSGIFASMVSDVNKRVNHLRDQIVENNRIFVALDDDNAVGYIFYAKAYNALYDMAVEIREIYVLPEYQRQGIGHELFSKALEEVSHLGYRTLILYCPKNISSISFFLKMGGEKREVFSRDISGYNIDCDLVYYDLDKILSGSINDSWNDIYEAAQKSLGLLNEVNKELAVVVTDNGKMYLGLGVFNRICPLESAISNMHIGGEKMISQILIMNKLGKPVLPCGKCRDLLIKLGQENASILFDFGTLKTMSMKELNPYYKDEEKV